MKIARLLAAALVALGTFPLVAQQADASAQQNATAAAAGSHAGESSKANAQTSADGARVKGSGTAAGAAEMRPVNGELVGKMDSKSARTGDKVVVKTTESVKTADGTVIPKGSRLVGHVTDVQAHGSGHADSQMAIEFDRAELKNGQSMAIHSEIQSLARPAAATSMDSDDGFAAPPMGGGARAMGGGRASGGGLVGGRGGLAGGALNGAANTTERAGAGLGSAASGSERTTGHLAGNAAAGVGGRAHAAAGAASGATAHATGIPGVMLAGRGNATGSASASGTLSATRKNIHLDSGTQMVLGVAAESNK